MMSGEEDLASELLESFREEKLVQVAQAAHAIVCEHIEQGGNSDGEFAPLRYRRPDGTDGPPLFDTGDHLLASIQYSEEDGKAVVSSDFVGARLLHDGGDVDYGPKGRSFRIFGGTVWIRRAHYPARPFMELTEDDGESLASEISD